MAAKKTERRVQLNVDPAANENTRRQRPVLSEQEALVLRLLAAGVPTSAIADRLAVNEPEVKQHIKALLLKVRAKSKPSLVSHGPTPD
ncbi:LuxR C-terminal-related transcriptional regulator [Microvirga calopogonii]|uniref:LuxR C-terminal-related transcriptional regulator n=1 Tax=Microvirga calopogonii TaxID=2078013 RepID=UPI000E0CED5F|nr:LuxR C-terminal-related transcriptional regulator [Microvirga calopogonii]